jgi:peptidoglycan-associated lipoprotein
MRHKALLLLLFIFGILPLKAQISFRDPAPWVPRYTTSITYSTTRGNAPPEGACQCFQTQGLGASNAVTLKYWLRAYSEVSRSTALSIGPLGQNLTLTTVVAGPQMVFHGPHFDTFAQATLGLAHASNSYFPQGNTYTTSANSMAFKTGGGVDVNLNHRFALRVLDLQYLHTSFPNGANDSQNHMVLAGGLVVKFNGRLWTPGY